MPVSTLTALVLRCPRCGQMEVKALSLFSLSGTKGVEVYCSCGARLVRLVTRNHRDFSLIFTCALCDHEHRLHFLRQELWGSRFIGIDCPGTGLRIGGVGTAREEVRRYLASEGPGWSYPGVDPGLGSHFFENPQVMYQVLDYLQFLAEEGRLFCACGNVHLEVQAFPDRLELCCFLCGGYLRVRAAAAGDLSWLQRQPEVRLAIGRHGRGPAGGRGKTTMPR